MVTTIQSREAQSGRDAMCSVPKAHNVTAQGNALGKCETNGPSPNGAKGSCPAYAFQGFPAQDCLFPGAMPQAFTWCRVAAKPFGRANPVDRTKAGSTNHPSKHNFFAAHAGPASNGSTGPPCVQANGGPLRPISRLSRNTSKKIQFSF